MFENAYFGKQYKTRDGRKAIYQRNFLSKYIDSADGKEHYISLHTIMTSQHVWQVDDEGKREDLRRMSNNFDIVSEWQEPIDEDKLAELAYTTFPDEEDDEDSCAINLINYSLRNAYKAGYRKAKEERT